MNGRRQKDKVLRSWAMKGSRETGQLLKGTVEMQHIFPFSFFPFFVAKMGNTTAYLEPVERLQYKKKVGGTKEAKDILG